MTVDPSTELDGQVSASRRFWAFSRPVSTVGRAVRWVLHRWPTALALLLSYGNLVEPSIVPAWPLLVLGAEYLVIGAFRRQFADRRLLALHVAGFAAYAVLAAASTLVDPDTGLYLIAAGWLLHAVWDAILHRADKVVWRWYAEACGVFDVAIGVSLLILLS